MTTFDNYQRTTEYVKDHILEENRFLTRRLAESQQSFELLKFVHFDKSINLDTLNDIIVGCTGCLYSMMFYQDRVITNLTEDDMIYRIILRHRKELMSYSELLVSDKILPEYTIVQYPVSPSQMISEQHAIKNIILIYPTKFVTSEVLDFVKSFMIVNDVLINIVLMREKMYELIETDPLTKLLNRSTWNTNLEEIIRESKPFFILFIDIDNFKNLNDSYGHLKGDEVLKITGAWLKNIFRGDDQVYRLGGDEFAVIGKINKESIKGLYHKFEKLNNGYKTAISTFLGIDSTISIGALITEAHKDIETIYSEVDKLLYESKSSGRNKLQILSELNERD